MNKPFPVSQLPPNVKVPAKQPLLAVLREISPPAPFNPRQIPLPVQQIFEVSPPFEIIAKIPEKTPRPGKMKLRRLIPGQQLQQAQPRFLKINRGKGGKPPSLQSLRLFRFPPSWGRRPQTPGGSAPLPFAGMGENPGPPGPP